MDELLKNLFDVTPPVGLVVFLNVFFFLCKKSPLFPAKYIPWISFLCGGMIYPLISEPGKTGFAVHSPLLAQIIMGLTLGGTAVAMHQAKKNIPLIGGLFNDENSTPDSQPPTVAPPSNISSFLLFLFVGLNFVQVAFAQAIFVPGRGGGSVVVGSATNYWFLSAVEPGALQPTNTYPIYLPSSLHVVGAITNDALQSNRLLFGSSTKVIGSLVPGNSGEVLFSQGAGLVPVWADYKNPTSGYLPYNNGVSFVDSTWFQVATNIVATATYSRFGTTNALPNFSTKPIVGIRSITDPAVTIDTLHTGSSYSPVNVYMVVTNGSSVPLVYIQGASAGSLGATARLVQIDAFAATAGGTNSPLDNSVSGTVGFYTDATSGSNTNTSNTGVVGSADGNGHWNVGLAGLGSRLGSGNANAKYVGVMGRGKGTLSGSQMRIGGLFETKTAADTANAVAANSSVIILDNNTTGDPFITLQTNGVAVGKFTRDANGLNINMDVTVGRLIATNSVLVGSSGTAGRVTVLDTDGSNSASVSADPTTTTDVNMRLPAAPFSGLLKGTVSGTTNWIISQATAGTDYASGVANPTASIGLSAVNGSATTAMRSDGAPALDQSITPFWSGLHTWTNDMTMKPPSGVGAADTVANTPVGLILQQGATLGATSGNQKSSPSLRWSASGWSELAGGSALSAIIGAYVRATQNTGADPTFDLLFRGAYTGVGYKDLLLLSALGNVVPGISGALSTSATDGMFYLPGTAGTPTGVPTTYTGKVATLVDTSNNLLYYYSGGAWRTLAAANPTATIGLSAVNGTAATFMRSDGAPALSQAIAPTWTGAHTFTPSSGKAITINPVAGTYAMDIASAGDTTALTFNNGVARIYTPGASQVLWLRTASSLLQVGTTGTSDNVIGLGGSTDTLMYKDAAGVWAQRNGTNAQTFRIYNTFTDSSNYERGFMRWNGNALEIGMEKAGTGATRTVRLVDVNGNAAISYSTTDVGIGGALLITGNNGSFYAPANGVIRLSNNGQTDFNRLQFGGTSSSFPSIKKNGTALNVRLADDSADADLTAKKLSASGGVSSTDTTAAVAIDATGWTNTFGKNAVVYLDGTAVTYTVYNNAGTAVYTNAAVVAHADIILQTSGKVIVTAGTGVSGIATPF